MRRLGTVVSIFVFGCASSKSPDPGIEDASHVDSASDALIASEAGDSLIPSDADAGGPPQDLWKSGTRLRAKTYGVGADARRFAAWHDTELDLDCTFARVSDQLHCVPRETSIVYADSGCSTRIAVKPSKCGSAAKYAFENASAPSKSGECGPELDVGQVYAVGTKMATPAVVYAKSASGCTATTILADADYYSVGEVVDPATFSAGTLTYYPRGEGLYVADVYSGVSGESAHLFIGPGSCRPVQIADRKYACPKLPFAYIEPGENAFFDAACSQPLAVHYESGCGVRPSLVVDRSTSCEPPTYYAASDENWHGFYQKDGGVCSSRPLGSPSVDGYYGKSAADWSKYTPITLVDHGKGSTKRQLLETPLGPVGEIEPGFVDATFGPVTLGQLPDGNYRAIPSEALVVSTTYADSACTKPIVQQTGCTLPPYIIEHASGASCRPSTAFVHVWKTGAASTPTTVYENVSGTCTPKAVTGTFYALGAEVTSTLPVMTYQVE